MRLFILLPLIVAVSVPQVQVVFLLSNGICNATSDTDLCRSSNAYCSPFVQCDADSHVTVVREFDAGKSFVTVLPPSIEYLPKLQSLIIHGGQLSGSIPSELARCDGLLILDIRNNKLLRGPIPIQLGALTRLQRLSLANNSLEGVLPTQLGQLAALKSLSLNSNHLTGVLPSHLNSLLLLENLYLSENQFSGPLPDLGKLSALKYLLVHLNRLNETIPSSIGSMRSLELFYAYRNSMTGSIPPEIANLTRLQRLVLNNNQLSGPIPTTIGQLSRLIQLTLAMNFLSGPIPDEIGLLSELEMLELADNTLNGSIPTTLRHSVSLRVLTLGNNRLSGVIPTQIGALSMLEDFSIAVNEISGTMPSEMANLRFLSDLSLGQNKLSGTIPSFLGNLSLWRLSLANNNLSGLVPTELAKSGLVSLDLSYNWHLGSDIPEMPRSLEYLDLSGNAFASRFSLFNCTRLQYLGLSLNYLTDVELRNCTRLVDVDISSNLITELPAFLLRGAGLDSLRFVDAKFNKISTPITNRLVFNPNLRTLDLSNNEIGGSECEFVFARYESDVASIVVSHRVAVEYNYISASFIRITELLDLNCLECENHTSIATLIQQKNSCPPEFYLQNGRQCLPCFGAEWNELPSNNSKFSVTWGSVLKDLGIEAIFKFRSFNCDACEDGRIRMQRDRLISYYNLCPADNRVLLENCSFPCRSIAWPPLDHHDDSELLLEVMRQIQNGNFIAEVMREYFSGLNQSFNGSIAFSPVHRMPHVLFDWLGATSVYFEIHSNHSQIAVLESIRMIVASIVPSISLSESSYYEFTISSDISVRVSSTRKLSQRAFIILIVAVLICVVLLIAASIATVLVIVYFRSNLHFLPEEISWSFKHKLKYFYKWSYSTGTLSSYYYRSIVARSEEWERISEFFGFYLDGSQFCIDSITSIYNPLLVASFINQYTVLQERFEKSPELFLKRNFSDQHLFERNRTMSKFDSRVKNCAWNMKSRVPILPLCHATETYTAEKICETGFATISLLDDGYYGSGIYFSSFALYTIPYLLRKTQPSLILAYVIPGNVFPVIEHPFSDASYRGKALKSGFNSHYVITKKDGFPLTADDKQSVEDSDEFGADCFDELLISQESQALPAFIFNFKRKHLLDIYQFYATSAEIEPSLGMDSTITTSASTTTTRRARVIALADDSRESRPVDEDSVSILLDEFVGSKLVL